VINRKPYSYVGIPLVRIVPADYNGWQIQARENEQSEVWADIPNGWFKTASEALDAAPVLCEF
jgi:hypothetical protein